MVFVAFLHELLEQLVLFPVAAETVGLGLHGAHRPEGAGYLGNGSRLGKGRWLGAEDGSTICLWRSVGRGTGLRMNGIPIEIHILQGVGLRVEEITDSGTVALSEDTVGRCVDRCAALPDDTSRTMALVTDKQSGIQERTYLSVGTADERIGHDTGFVAADAGNILLTHDACLVGIHRGHPHIGTEIACNGHDAVVGFSDFLHGSLLLQVQLVGLA